MKSKFTAKQWRVLIGSCLFQCAMIGVLINCSGVLFAQMRSEFGFSMSRVSLFNTLRSVTTALAAATVTAWFFRSKKARFLFVIQLITISAYLLLILGAQGPLWYVAAVLCGISGCVSTAAVPMTLNQWFPGNAGMATGIAMAFSGIGGAICNPLSASLIQSMGWKGAIVVLSVITLGLTVPGLMMMFHDEVPTPAVKPREKKKKESIRGAGRLGTVVLVTIVLLGGSIGITLAVNMSIFVQSLGYSLTVGATMTTMVMIGNVLTKFLFGTLCDKLGVWRATQCGLAMEAAALLCYLLLPGQVWLLYVVSVIYGFVYALTAVGLSRSVIAAYGAESGRFIGLHTSLYCGISAAASMLVGVLVDRLGGFQPVLILILALSVCSFVAAGILQARKGK